MKKLLLLACLTLTAFAQSAPDSPPPEDTAKLKADLVQSNERIAYLTKLCNGIEQQRNAANGRAENAALQLSIANESVADLKQKLADLQARYDMEIAKTEALMKEKGVNSAVTAKK